MLAVRDSKLLRNQTFCGHPDLQSSTFIPDVVS